MEWDPAVYKTLLESTRAIPWKIEGNIFEIMFSSTLDNQSISHLSQASGTLR